VSPPPPGASAGSHRQGRGRAGAPFCSFRRGGHQRRESWPDDRAPHHRFRWGATRPKVCSAACVEHSRPPDRPPRRPAARFTGGDARRGDPCTSPGHNAAGSTSHVRPAAQRPPRVSHTG
jgi:hypothetical protein